MWFRSELKERAKAVLKVSYWKAFLVSLVIAITGGSATRGVNINWRNNSHRWNNNAPVLGRYNYPHINNYVFSRVFTIIGISLLIVLIITIVFSIFVAEPLLVGGRKYFIQSAKNDVNINYLGYSFEKSAYMDIVKAMLWRSVITFLWFLLFIIPGIIKSYAYRMVPYFLGSLLCGIGIIFVRPYENATEAELYLVLKQNAIDNNLCTPYELGVVEDIKDDFY